MIFKPVVFDQFRAAGDTLLTGSEASAGRAASTPEIGFDLTIAGHRSSYSASVVVKA
jgi:hypothetical protein